LFKHLTAKYSHKVAFNCELGQFNPLIPENNFNLEALHAFRQTQNHRLMTLGLAAFILLDLATVYCIITTAETVTAGFSCWRREVTMVSMFSMYDLPLAVVGAVTPYRGF
jgi:hypothetical protein